MRRAVEESELPVEGFDYINAHGTSTPFNDEFETMAIKAVFGDHAQRLMVGSTKSMTGHLLGGAGGLEFVVTSLVLHEGKVPPTINLENPDPLCDLDYVPNTMRQADVRAALTNSFGFGGHNASLALGRYEQ
jgi:3-oxoacyl-[acyl-carrier-protein] synthase II